MDFDSKLRSSSQRGSSVKDEIQRLLKKNGKVTSQDFMRLRSMFKDDELIDQLQNSYSEKQSNLIKKAKKFAQLIREKYSETQTPFHMLLEKAHKYKVKYGLSEDEFAEFQRIYESELVGIKSLDVVQPSTNLAKVLGGITLDVHGFTGKLSDEDYKYLQQITQLHQTTRPLHAQVLLQSMKYKDLDLEAITGTYDRNMHRVGEHIHPVLAALFLPKFQILDNFFLFSNIAGIVKTRYAGEPLTSRPDYELFYALTTDPNDVVCSNSSTILDLYNRAQLQTQLWNCVLHLRNGQYYNASFKDFVSSVDLCRLNRQDTPDLIYGRYDGVILKRLLSAFSFRPTVVATTPASVNPVSINPYAFNVRPQVTSVPMINMRIPPKLADESAINLESALEQYQFFIEGGAIVPRNTSLIWSRGVLIFYVDRRATNINFNNHLTQYSMSNLPAPIAGFERLNTREVIFKETMQVRGEDYTLRSLVYSEVNVSNGSESDVVIGSSACVKSPPGSSFTGWFIYDPYGPINQRDADSRGLAILGGDWEHSDEAANVSKLGKKRGTIFVYATNASIDEKKEVSI